MPQINGMEHMVGHLNNIGWSSSNGMGISAISFQEIEAYNNITNAGLSPSEALILKNMSNAYVRQIQDKNPNKQPPFNAPKATL